MYKQNYISKDEYNEAMAEELDFVRGENEPSTSSVYSYYEEVVISDVVEDLANEKGISESTARQLLYNAGYDIYACIDMDIQKRSMRFTKILRLSPMRPMARPPSFRVR